MLAGLDGALRVVKVRLIRCADDDELDLGVRDDLVDATEDLDALGGLGAEAGLELSARALRVALEHAVEREELWEGEHEWDVERQAGETDSEHASLDGSSHCAISNVMRVSNLAIVYVARRAH